MNALDWVIIAIVAATVIVAVGFILKGRKSECSGCCAECHRAHSAQEKR